MWDGGGDEDAAKEKEPREEEEEDAEGSQANTEDLGESRAKHLEAQGQKKVHCVPCSCCFDRAVLKGRDFFLLRTALKDRP